MLRVKDIDGTKKDVQDVHVRDGGGLVPVKFIKVRGFDNRLYTVWQRLGVTAAAYVDGYGYSNAPIPITTSAPNPVVSGGRAPFTYSWSSNPGWAVLYPTQLNTSFRRLSVANGDSYDDNFTLTVTDADGNVATVTVAAHVENLGGTA